MNKITSKFLSILYIAAIVLMAGCDNGISVGGEVTFTGSVQCAPASVSDGETVALKIGPLDVTSDGSVGISTSTEINGKDPVKSISYYIDDVYVTESSDKNSGYSATYKVSGLAAGEHTVSAVCNSNFKKVKINSVIKPATIAVE